MPKRLAVVSQPEKQFLRDAERVRQARSEERQANEFSWTKPTPFRR